MVRNVVFWSGGQDSTLVAVQLLRAGEHVNLISFDNCWIGGEHQQNLEKLRRKQILQKLQEEFGGNKFEHKTITWDGDLFNCLQSRLWVSLFPMLCKDGDKAYFGAMSVDSFWHYDHDFKDIFERLCKFDDKKVELKFPLEWYSRKLIIKELKKFGYFDLAIHSGDKL